MTQSWRNRFCDSNSMNHTKWVIKSQKKCFFQFFFSNFQTWISHGYRWIWPMIWVLFENWKKWLLKKNWYSAKLLTMNSLSVTKNHYISIIVFAYLLSVTPIHNLFHTMNSQFWIRNLLSEITKDSISISKIYYEFTLFFCEITMSPSFFRNFTANLLSLSE